MLRRIDQPEVLEHEAALLGGEGGEPLPGRVAESGARARGPGREHARQMDAVADGRAADPPGPSAAAAPAPAHPAPAATQRGARAAPPPRRTPCPSARPRPGRGSAPGPEPWR